MADELTRGSAPKAGRRWRWRLSLGNLPLCLVAIAAVVGAVIVWPSDLSWGLVAVAGLATFAAGGFEIEFGE